MQISLSLDLTNSSTNVVGDTAGPIITTPPTTSAAAAFIDAEIIATPGAATAQGGGVIDLVQDWELDGNVVSNSNTFTPTLANEGLSLIYRVTWTETGGDADGTTVRSISLGFVRNDAAITSISGGLGEIVIDYEGVLTISGGTNEIILGVV